MEKVLVSLQKNFPQNEYRLTKEGRLQRRMSGKQWRAVCEHNREKSSCVECGGSQVCEHKLQRSQCKKCKGGSICKHKRKRSNCRECDGSDFCIHKKSRYHCVDCGGSGVCIHGILKANCVDCGGSLICEHKRKKYYCQLCNGNGLCEHKISRSICKICKGNGICKHDMYKTLCRECGSGGSYCEHNILRKNCRECIGCTICPCGVYCKVENGLCNYCNPNFVRCESGQSKIGCEFIDMLQIEINIQIQHRHLNKTDKTWKGDEYRIQEWRKKCVDGFYIDENGVKTIVEFLGDYYHGHPRLWGPDQDKKDRFSRLFKDVFLKTEKTLQKCKAFGYKVLDIWESEFKKRKTFQSLMSICHEFDGILDY